MNKTVLITGGSRGIGAELVRTFAQAGYNVAFSYKNSEDKALKLEKELNNQNVNVKAFKCDNNILENNTELVNEVLSVFGKIDVLINNAGICCSNLLIDTINDKIEEIMNVNLLSAIVTTREAVKSMISNNYGRIINISSIWGVNGASMETVYSASKAGLIGFTEGLAKEVGLMGITVNSIAPGVIMTDMMKGYSKEELKELESRTSVGRLGSPEDISKVALFLASDDSSYITGQCITVDGNFC